MPPSATAAWLRARFEDEVSRRFRGANADARIRDDDLADPMMRDDETVATGAREKSSTALRVSFALPVASYATTLLQHLTGEGLSGQMEEWWDGDGQKDEDGREEFEEYEGGEEGYSAAGGGGE